MGGFATKHNVYKSLIQIRDLHEHVPETRLFSIGTLKAMLDKYTMVYVKPNNGTGGKDVFRVEQVKENKYFFQVNTEIRTFYTFEDLFKAIEKLRYKRVFVVQRGIELLKYDGRRFDLRIMVQKNPNQKWDTTGIIGRLGHPRKIVTNVCKGGSSKPVELLLARHVSDIDAYTNKLKDLGCRAVAQLNKTFPLIKEIGFDVGIDSNLRPWILEANPRPAIYGFKILKDKRIYQKIRRYQIMNGRR
ncbi:YheC/YheD family protein [Cohnella candidum]|uniref:YheC/YheD family protein n=1 Tax=Cohnella candidum TaxID=2674991 RepID=A0A3G3JW12_9BACL|nr:YheC/YheD family protein [Cohnella candidum]AYQ72440.1 YheC/YheD family protein [Cohnella candidum]